MSHITECKAEVTDLDALDRAAQRLGGRLIRGQKTHEWYGTWVGDTEMPAGMSRRDLGKCDHAIAFPDCKYEVGVVEQDGKLKLRYDWYHLGGLEKKLGGQNAEKLIQHYGLERAKKAAERRRLRTKEVVQSDGSIKLIVEGV